MAVDRQDSLAPHLAPYLQGSPMQLCSSPEDPRIARSCQWAGGPWTGGADAQGLQGNAPLANANLHAGQTGGRSYKRPG